MSQVAEKYQSLWLLIASPIIWAAHFLLSYITAAIWCEKAAGPGGSLAFALAAIGVYTLLALVGIGVTGWMGYRRHSLGSADVPHDDDTPEDRHRFLGFATLLMSALSAVAVLYAALVILFFRRCY
jgi:hypothetical protein